MKTKTIIAIILTLTIVPAMVLAGTNYTEELKTDANKPEKELVKTLEKIIEKDYKKKYTEIPETVKVIQIHVYGNIVLVLLEINDEQFTMLTTLDKII